LYPQTRSSAQIPDADIVVTAVVTAERIRLLGAGVRRCHGSELLDATVKPIADIVRVALCLDPAID
jgi:hypothetical protein